MVAFEFGFNLFVRDRDGNHDDIDKDNANLSHANTVVVKTTGKTST